MEVQGCKDVRVQWIDRRCREVGRSAGRWVRCRKVGRGAGRWGEVQEGRERCWEVG